MSLLDKLTEDMKTAMKAGEKDRLSTIRLLRGYIKTASIDQQKELNETEEMAILMSAAKKRKESIQAYSDAGRTDLADKEQAELQVIQGYLPQALTDDEIENIVVAAIEEVGAQSMQDLGKVMPVAIKMAAGRADGKQINAVVRQKLG
jgi:uncharacterized protein YqeY